MGEASHHHHRATAPARIRCAVITVSDTRTAETDTSGRLLREGLKEGGHEIVAHAILKDEPATIVATVRQMVAEGAQTVILTGGTGITARDGTYEALAGLLEKRIDGFGELFRHLSYLEIGTAAMLSRAQAGLFGGAVVISVPGSSGACRLALEMLILPELPHMVREAGR